MALFSSHDVNINGVMTGYSTGGSFRSRWVHQGYQVMAFESPKLENSRMFETLNRGRGDPLGWETMINVYSSGSLTCRNQMQQPIFNCLLWAPSLAQQMYTQHSVKLQIQIRPFLQPRRWKRTFESYFNSWGRTRMASITE